MTNCNGIILAKILVIAWLFMFSRLHKIMVHCSHLTNQNVPLIEHNIPTVNCLIFKLCRGSFRIVSHALLEMNLIIWHTHIYIYIYAWISRLCFHNITYACVALEGLLGMNGLTHMHPVWSHQCSNHSLNCILRMIYFYGFLRVIFGYYC